MSNENNSHICINLYLKVNKYVIFIPKSMGQTFDFPPCLHNYVLVVHAIHTKDRSPTKCLLIRKTWIRHLMKRSTTSFLLSLFCTTQNTHVFRPLPITKYVWLQMHGISAPLWADFTISVCTCSHQSLSGRLILVYIKHRYTYYVRYCQECVCAKENTGLHLLAEHKDVRYWI